MGVSERMYTYTYHGGQKVRVPMEQVNELSQLQKGDHIVFDRSGVYEHHAIVEYIDEEKGTIHVIEYTNTAKEFLRDNISPPPKNPGKAIVKRSNYLLQSEKLFVIKHKKSLDSDTVALRGLSRLGKRDYDLLTNNCEHFALWCKIGISSSEQVNNLQDHVEKDTVKQGLSLAIGFATKTASVGGKTIVTTTVREVTKDVVTHTVTKGGQEVLKTGVQTAAKQVVTQAVTKGGQEVLKTGVQTAAKQVVSQTVTKGGQEVLKTGVQTAAKQVVSQTVTKGGQEVLKTGVQTAAKQVVSQTVTKGGQEVLKTGVGEAAKQVTTQTVCNSGKTVVKTGLMKVSKQVVSQSVSRGGKEIVERGTREATKEVFTRTATKAGEEIVTKGTRETTREVITQTSKSNGAAVGESALGGAVFAVALEGAFAVYDIHCANEDLKSGKISKAVYNDAVGKRILGGIGNVGGSTVGAIVGQGLIPIPVVGGLIGSVAGGMVGKLSGHSLWKSI